jgi:hypothetical protein
MVNSFLVEKHEIGRADVDSEGGGCKTCGKERRGEQPSLQFREQTETQRKSSAIAVESPWRAPVPQEFVMRVQSGYRRYPCVIEAPSPPTMLGLGRAGAVASPHSAGSLAAGEVLCAVWQPRGARAMRGGTRLIRAGIECAPAFFRRRWGSRRATLLLDSRCIFSGALPRGDGPPRSPKHGGPGVSSPGGEG